MEDVCEDGMQNLGRRLVLMLIRAGILVGQVGVVAVGGDGNGGGGSDIFF